jgi:hypothetical protein
MMRFAALVGVSGRAARENASSGRAESRRPVSLRGFAVLLLAGWETRRDLPELLCQRS